MSRSLHDTAWVSMIEKDATCLFPKCFDFILAQQLPCGVWDSYASPVDGILNKAAGLLVFKKRLKNSPNHPDWLFRSNRAVTALKKMLESWDVDSSDQVRFEMMVIQHLSLLEGEGVVLHFPELDMLRSHCSTKVAKLPPECVYKAPSTLYHSLEALIGHTDFERVRRWRDPNGSMIGSPSSTAAYLMNVTLWDNEAEAYLETALKYSTGKGNGSVPCAWPTSVLEVSWVSRDS